MNRRELLAALGLAIIGPHLVRYTRPAPADSTRVFLHCWYACDYIEKPGYIGALERAEAARELRDRVASICAPLGEEDQRIALALSEHFWKEDRTYDMERRRRRITLSTKFGWPSWQGEVTA